MRHNERGGIDVVFDAIKRKEFLSGFRKRKNHRRKCAKEGLERSIKEERKRIRREIKNEFKHLTKSYEPLKELSQEDDDDDNKSDVVSEFEDENVKLKIVNLNTQELNAQYHLLGVNQSKVDRIEKNTQVKAAVKESHIANYVPGMDHGINRGYRRSESDIKALVCHNNKNVKYLGIHNKTQIDHFKKVKSLKQMKRSRIFQMKERMDRSTNKKRARQKLNKILKSLPNHLKRAAKKQKTTKRYLKRRFVNGNRIK